MHQCLKKSQSPRGQQTLHDSEMVSTASRSAAAQQCSEKRLTRDTEEANTTQDDEEGATAVSLDGKLARHELAVRADDEGANDA